MFGFLDFIFYRTYKQYISWGESDVPGVYALCVITLFPCLNISSLIFFGFDFFKIKSGNYNAWVILLFFLLVIFLNYYRVYKRIGIINLIKKLDEVGDERKKQLTRWMIAYLVVSVVILFISIAY
jgi:hypothetical protein